MSTAADQAMDPRVTELHSIMPMVNIGSVMAHGLLSYERAAALSIASVAMQPVQDRPDQKVVPGGLKLHHRAAELYSSRIEERAPLRAHALPIAAFLLLLLFLIARSAGAGETWRIAEQEGDDRAHRP